MSVTYHVIILAFIQGLTEFLPISSSAHLVILPWFMSWQDQGLLMDVAVHVGTLLSVMLYFRADVISLFCGFFETFQTKKTNRFQLFWQLVIATIPVVIAGVLIESLFNGGLRSIAVIAFASIIFGLMLYWIDHKNSSNADIESMTYGKAFWAGLGQSLAVIPGASRSGTSIFALRSLGLSRTGAAHYSCLMSIPTIIAAATYTGCKWFQTGDSQLMFHVLIAIVLSFAIGYLSIGFMMKWLEKASYNIFVGYRVILGIILLIVLAVQ